MTDITALESKLKLKATLEDAITVLISEIEALKSAKVKEWPQVGDVYFYISSAGMVLPSTWRDDNPDKDCAEIGNIFRTEAEATKELETRKTIAELRAQPGREKFVIGEYNHSLSVDFKIGVDVNAFTTCDYGFASIYFDSAESVQSAIKAVGADRILAASKWLSMGE